MKVDGFLGRYPIYLILFCITLPLSYYEVYSAFFDLPSIVPATAALLALTLVLFICVRCVLPNTLSAAPVVLVLLILLTLKVSLVASVYLLILVAVVACFLFQMVKRKRRLRDAILPTPGFTMALNSIAAINLVAICLFCVFNAYQVADLADDISTQASAELPKHPAAARSAPLPNIVHIVLDGYSRADVLQKDYGFDNTPFMDALRQRGFQIADRATAPYNQTLFSMSSIFLLRPVTEAMDISLTGANQTITRRALARVLGDGNVVRILRNVGYALQSTPSTVPILQWDRIFGHYNDTASAFAHFRLRGTYMLTHDILSGIPGLNALFGAIFGNPFDIVGINYEYLKHIPNRRFQQRDNKPQFIYEHILAPHPPFNIRADGELRSFPVRNSPINDGALNAGYVPAHYRDGYIAKLQYINHAILEQIDAIQESIVGPLIIVLHGDHGGGLHYDQTEKANSCMAERFSPLLAVFATDPALSADFKIEFTREFNLVNTYRVILRRMLDFDVPNLPSASTFIPWNMATSSIVQVQERAASCRSSERTLTAQQPPKTPAANTPDAVRR